MQRASWAPGGTLELDGELPAGAAWDEIEIATDRGEAHRFPLERTPDGGFSARLPVAAIESLAGALPLTEGPWRLRAGGVPMVIADALDEQLPLSTVVDRKPFSLGLTADGEALLSVQRDLDEDERGRYNQLRLRETAYKPARTAPLRDAVVYTSFLGRQYSDSPRAIHEETGPSRPAARAPVGRARRPLPGAGHGHASCARAVASTTRRWPPPAS